MQSKKLTTPFWHVWNKVTQGIDAEACTKTKPSSTNNMRTERVMMHTKNYTWTGTGKIRKRSIWPCLGCVWHLFTFQLFISFFSVSQGDFSLFPSFLTPENVQHPLAINRVLAMWDARRWQETNQAKYNENVLPPEIAHKNHADDVAAVGKRRGSSLRKFDIVCPDNTTNQTVCQNERQQEMPNKMSKCMPTRSPKHLKHHLPDRTASGMPALMSHDVHSKHINTKMGQLNLACQHIWPTNVRRNPKNMNISTWRAHTHKIMRNTLLYPHFACATRHFA